MKMIHETNKIPSAFVVTMNVKIMLKVKLFTLRVDCSLTIIANEKKNPVVYYKHPHPCSVCL